jgi:hypothetical protein
VLLSAGVVDSAIGLPSSTWRRLWAGAGCRGWKSAAELARDHALDEARIGEMIAGQRPAPAGEICALLLA